MSKGGEEKRKFGEVPRSPSVAGASAAAGSQKATSTPLATFEMGRIGAKARHSARQAAVRTSPFQQAGIRAPAAVHQGHRLYVACSRMGHSKLRWRRPGKATLMAQVQPVPVNGNRQPDVSADDEGGDGTADERGPGLGLARSRGRPGLAGCRGQRRSAPRLMRERKRRGEIGRRWKVGGRRRKGRRRHGSAGGRRRGGPGHQLLDLLGSLSLVQTSTEEDVLPPEWEEEFEVRGVY